MRPPRGRELSRFSCRMLRRLRISKAIEHRPPAAAGAASTTRHTPPMGYCRAIAILRRSSGEIRWSRSSAASAMSICTHSTVPVKRLPSDV